MPPVPEIPGFVGGAQRERPFFQPNDYVQGEKAPTVAPPPPVPIARNPRQIFISHAHQDAAVAQQLARDLAAHGYDIWIAPDSIRPGEKWVEAINYGLEESAIFVLLLSLDAVTSHWVQMETNVAISLIHEGEIQLFPLILKACRMPALWRAFQHISLQSSYEQGFNQLLLAVDPKRGGTTIVDNTEAVTSPNKAVAPPNTKMSVLDIIRINPQTGLYIGRLKWYNSQKGYGFISRGGGEEIFFTRTMPPTT